MRIVYLFRWNDEADSGVVKKVKNQAQTWAQMGNDVIVLLLSYAHAPIAQATVDFGVPTIRVTFHPPFETNLAAWKVSRHIASLNPDIVYVRQMPFYPGLLPLYNHFRVVTEVNTNDLGQYRQSFHGLQRPKYWYHLATRRWLLQRSAGFVFVSHEIARLPHYRIFNKPFEVIGNGIALENYAPFPPPQNEYPRLVFLGSPRQNWHGVDKIARLAQLFPKWRFDVIGPSCDEIAQIPPNLHCHGYLPTTQYQQFVAQADIGLGTLALHRKEMEEASPLKVREYLAWGLPVITAYQDTDFPSGAPFLLRLPNKEDNITPYRDQIEKFVHQWQNKRVPRTAIAHLDIKAKEKKRLEFFQRLLTQPNAEQQR